MAKKRAKQFSVPAVRTQQTITRLRSELESILYQAGGYGWNHYGFYRGKAIVLGEDQLKRITAVHEESSRA